MPRGYRLVLLTTAFFCAIAAQAQDAPDPEKPGPFPVGVTTLQLVDHSRTDESSKGPRSLLTEIWYPATDETKELPKNSLVDYYLGGKNIGYMIAMGLAFGADIREVSKTFPSIAVRDARVRDGRFPLIVFSHGNGGLRTQSPFLCEHLASHGYIVVAPDHTGNCAATVVGEEVVIFNEDMRKQSEVDRPKDVSFLIDTMIRFSKGGDSRFLGRIDAEHIGVTGHSFGGYTSTLVADADPRVKAIAPITGVAKSRTNYNCPVLVVVATEDKTIKAEGNDRARLYYEESKGPHYLVEFKNAGHFSFTCMYYFKPDFGDGVGQGERITNGEPITYLPMETVYRLTNGYVTAFFGRELKNIGAYEEFLQSNPDPNELIVKWQRPAATAETTSGG
ncbi:MAG: dienelactone hydrolase family protein [Candidatus Hydrogenedentes bacterium]|nr:dienelactone hydrolase family protein [Candidatus Hydrogenedentota bacterium]